MTSFKKKVKAGDMDSFQYWIRSGTPWVWVNAAAVSASIILVVGLLMLILSLIHISEPTRLVHSSRMPSSA